MAKANGPLHSERASGTIANLLTFSQRSTGQQVRFQRQQQDFITTGRVIARTAYSAAVLEWLALDTDSKKQWKALASSLQMTGYNLFIKIYISEGVGSGYGKRLYGLFNLGL